MTRILLLVSSLLFAVAGLAATFAPRELLSAAGFPADPRLPLLVQMLGAAWCGFAFANWTAKDSLYGGIYARPLAVANAVHTTVAAFALGKGAARMAAAGLVWAAAALFAVLAAGFFAALFRNPLADREAGTSSLSRDGGT